MRTPRSPGRGETIADRLEADPPSHTRTRAVLNKVLSPAVMKQNEAQRMRDFKMTGSAQVCNCEMSTEPFARDRSLLTRCAAA